MEQSFCKGESNGNKEMDDHNVRRRGESEEGSRGRKQRGSQGEGGRGSLACHEGHSTKAQIRRKRRSNRIEVKSSTSPLHRTARSRRGGKENKCSITMH